MNEIMRQAARLQRKIEETKTKLKDTEITHTMSDGKISVVVTYGGKVGRITIDPAFLASEGLDMSLDAVVACTNGALEAADKAMSAELEKVTGGVKVPGMF